MMDQSTQVTGKKTKFMVLGSTLGTMVDAMMENGLKIIWMDMGYTHGKMVENMKDSM